MSCSDYCPPLTEQLHGPDPTAGSDCAIACARMALQFATCGRIDASIDKIRKQSGLDKPDPPGDYSTTMTEYVKALNSFDARARELGYDGITANSVERGRWTDLEPKLKAEDRWATVFVDYGVVNDREPSKTGDKGFRGAHAVSVYGYKSKSETSDGTVKYRVFDPLCDGRRSDIPKGPVYWKASTLKDACDVYAGGGSGTATWCITPRSKSTAPAPEPPDPCATSYEADARALFNEARDFLLATPFGEALAEVIRRHQGTNPEGLALPVHSGVTPDDG